jgi:hypothetical protein
MIAYMMNWDEQEFLKAASRKNSISDRQICRALNPCEMVDPPSNYPGPVTSEPSVELIFNHTSRVFSSHIIKLVSLLTRKISSLLWQVRDDLGLKTCDCGQDNIGQACHLINNRVKGQNWHIHLNHPKMLALAEHSMHDIRTSHPAPKH